MLYKNLILFFISGSRGGLFLCLLLLFIFLIWFRVFSVVIVFLDVWSIVEELGYDFLVGLFFDVIKRFKVFKKEKSCLKNCFRRRMIMGMEFYLGDGREEEGM